MAAVQALNPAIRNGAAVVIGEDDHLVHLPAVHRLGRGTHTKTLSSYFLIGHIPLHWSTMCGKPGIVVFMCSLLADEGTVCTECDHLTIEAPG